MAKGTEKRKSNNLIWLAVSILAVAIISIFMMNPADVNIGLASSVSVAEASELRDAGAFILDVRQPEEWEQVHIPGAVLIPLGELASRVDEVPQDQQIVVVCRSGNRSQQGRDILLGAGFTEVTSMNGGVTQWQAAGLPVVSGP